MEVPCHSMDHRIVAWGRRLQRWHCPGGKWITNKEGVATSQIWVLMGCWSPWTFMLSQNKQYMEVCYGRPPTSFTLVLLSLLSQWGLVLLSQFNREATKILLKILCAGHGTAWIQTLLERILGTCCKIAPLFIAEGGSPPSSLLPRTKRLV